MKLTKVNLVNKGSNGVLNLGAVSNMKHDVTHTLVLHARAIIEKDHQPEVLNLTFVTTHGYSFERETAFYLVSNIQVFNTCPDKGVESSKLDKTIVSQAVLQDIKKELSNQAVAFFIKNNLHYKYVSRYQRLINKIKSFFTKREKADVKIN